MPRTRELWAVPTGTVEVILDAPDKGSRGVAMVAHPHPLLGGTPEHKVPAFLASRLCEEGWIVVRPSFRGVGATSGVHDGGIGEADDLCFLAAECRRRFRVGPLALVGYSFGAFVQARVWRALDGAGSAPAALALVASGVGTVAADRSYELGTLPANTLVAHGEFDEQVSLNSVLRWAEPLGIAVTIVPGADHAFSRRLSVLGNVVAARLRPLIS